ncbi:hypothetical protein FKX85_02410 [Echinicola soli]|uniref:Uncharacterized protein n=1 Tax=Echinicola soli TaxID=2591634 RepID=A0A514CDP6_9BACT|nr:hypothetical protein [Echinicola soli]QDH77949.1 hypothetical protein FKX85_02410 [Echinicola soli]
MRTYKDALKESCSTIEEARDLVFTALINVAMTGEYKDIDELFEEGDVVRFSTAHFLNSEDNNIQMLLALVGQLEQTHDSLLNLNGLDHDNSTQ